MSENTYEWKINGETLEQLVARLVREVESNAGNYSRTSADIIEQYTNELDNYGLLRLAMKVEPCLRKEDRDTYLHPEEGVLQRTLKTAILGLQALVERDTVQDAKK